MATEARSAGADDRKLARLVVLVAEASQGVAPVIVMLAVPRVDRRRCVTKRNLLNYGHATGVGRAFSWHNAKVSQMPKSHWRGYGGRRRSERR